jgi:hypothetical protein
MPTLTIHIAEKGTPCADGTPSKKGHMWYSVNDGLGNINSYGFAPINGLAYGDGDINIHGSDSDYYLASNTIDGGNGNDLIKVDSPLYSDGRFVNTLSGGTGNDRLEAGGGADTYLSAGATVRIPSTITATAPMAMQSARTRLSSVPG